MPRYGLVWLEIAREHYASLPAAARAQIDAQIEQLLENPRQHFPLSLRRGHRSMDDHFLRGEVAATADSQRNREHSGS